MSKAERERRVRKKQWQKTRTTSRDTRRRVSIEDEEILKYLGKDQQREPLTHEAWWEFDDLRSDERYEHDRRYTGDPFRKWEVQEEESEMKSHEPILPKFAKDEEDYVLVELNDLSL